MSIIKRFSWVAAALCVTGVGAYALAEPKPAAACGAECPMHQAASLATIKVEQTKQGAVIQLVAKKPEDVSKVQQNAQQMASMLSSGSCPMHAAHGGGMHGHGDGHGHGHDHHDHHEAQPSAAPSK